MQTWHLWARAGFKGQQPDQKAIHASRNERNTVAERIDTKGKDRRTIMVAVVMDGIGRAIETAIGTGGTGGGVGVQDIG